MYAQNKRTQNANISSHLFENSVAFAAFHCK